MLNSKKLLPIIILVFVAIILITYTYKESDNVTSQDPYKEIYSDDRRIWSFDVNSIELSENTLQNESYVNVWIKIEYKNFTAPTGGIDLLLWHLDTNERRYKVSDTCGYNISDGTLVET